MSVCFGVIIQLGKCYTRMIYSQPKVNITIQLLVTRIRKDVNISMEISHLSEYPDVSMHNVPKIVCQSEHIKSVM